jgi:hypothetical protein
MQATVMNAATTTPESHVLEIEPIAPLVIPPGATAKTPASQHASRRTMLLLLLIILFGAVLRVAPLRHESLEGDEVFSRQVALLPMRSALNVIRDDLVHPPLYYFLLKAGISAWGATPLGIRLWSLLFGIATIPLVAAIGARLPGSRHTGLWAAAILAVNQCHIFYSQQARSYSVYAFLILLLVYWVTAITRKNQRNRLFATGTVLMILLIYLHYVAAIYIFSTALAIVACKLPVRTKILAVLGAGLSAISFLPWLITEVHVCQAKHGVGQNLDWQGHPGFYQLKEFGASAIGIMDFRGAPTLAFLVVAALAFAAPNFSSPQRSLSGSPVVVTLTSIAIVPPLLVFVLSIPPLNLPLWGLRHLLPSIIALGLLCCYGLEALASLSARLNGYRLAAATSVLLLLALATTTLRMLQGPTRYPYQRIAEDIEMRADTKEQVYTTWFYGIGEPVNYYCATKCVQPLPTDDSALPEAMVLLYRPNATQEVQRYKQLLKEGFTTDSYGRYYAEGKQTPWGTSSVYLTRRDTQASRDASPDLHAQLR